MISINEFSVVIATHFRLTEKFDKKLIGVIESLEFVKIGQHLTAKDFPISLAVDGIRNDYVGNRIIEGRFKTYIEFINNLHSNYANLQVFYSADQAHLSGNLLNCIDKIKSDWILVVQEDLPFIRKVDITNIFDIKDFNGVIRFNKRPNSIAGLDTQIIPANLSEKVSLLSTNNWSDNNHLCKTEYYRNLVRPLILNHFGYPETIMYPQNLKYPSIYNTFIFGALGELPFIRHTGEDSRTIDILIKRFPIFLKLGVSFYYILLKMVQFKYFYRKKLKSFKIALWVQRK